MSDGKSGGRIVLSALMGAILFVLAPATGAIAQVTPQGDGAPRITLTAAMALSPRDPGVGPVTGFPLPHYVSLNTSEANARRGPSRTHRVDWVYTQRGTPLIIVDEYGPWRRVVDRDGQGGWIYKDLLTGTRTAIIETDMLEFRANPEEDAQVRAQAELGAIVRLEECRPDWCLLSAQGQRGWVPAAALWGVDPGEVFD